MGTKAIIAIVIGVIFVLVVILGIILTIRLNKRRDRILDEGEHTFGWLVQANNELYEKGNMDLPALMIISPDRETNDDEEFMTGLASEIFELKEEDPDDCETDGEAKVARLMADETYIEGRRDKLPKSFTDGKTVYLVHFYVFRDHLPKKKLGDSPRVPVAIIWDEDDSLVCTRPVKKSKKKRRDEEEDDD
jgi:hypothetical protein